MMRNDANHCLDDNAAEIVMMAMCCSAGEC